MKPLQVALLKFVLFYCILLSSANVMAQSAIQTANTAPVTEKPAIDKTVSLVPNTTETPVIQNINKYCLGGYRIKVRRQKDYYLIPWALRKKHFKYC